MAATAPLLRVPSQVALAPVPSEEDACLKSSERNMHPLLLRVNLGARRILRALEGDPGKPAWERALHIAVAVLVAVVCVAVVFGAVMEGRKRLDWGGEEAGGDKTMALEGLADAKDSVDSALDSWGPASFKTNAEGEGLLKEKAAEAEEAAAIRAASTLRMPTWDASAPDLPRQTRPPPKNKMTHKQCSQFKAEPMIRLNLPRGTCKCGRHSCADYDTPPVSLVLPPGPGGLEAFTDRLGQAAGPTLARYPTSEVLAAVPIDGEKGAMTAKLSKRLITHVLQKTNPGYRKNLMERAVLVHPLGTLASKPAVVESALVRGAAGTDVVVAFPGDSSELSLINTRSLGIAQPDCAGAPKMASLLIQYFRRPKTIATIAKAIGGKSRYKMATEVIVHDDSASELGIWLGALRATKQDGYVLEAGNVHEIRGYNRMVKMARGDIVALLQDDDAPPSSGAWLSRAQALFTAFPRLALLGGYSGTIQGGPLSGKYSPFSGSKKERSRLSMPSADIGKFAPGTRFMFVTFTNLGPFVMRRRFLMRSGLMNRNFSCRGDPGIGFDYEVGLRMWKDGRQVGLYNHGHTFNIGNSGSSGTRASMSAYRSRLRIETRNTAWYTKMYAPFYINHARMRGEGGGDEQRSIMPVGQGRFSSARAISVSRMSKVHKMVHEANLGIGLGGGEGKGWEQRRRWPPAQGRVG